MLQFVPLLGPVIERLASLIPDPQERARAVQQAQSEMLATLQASDAAQADINKVEASSPHPFAAFWRPAAGWVAVAGLAYDALLRPLLPWVLTVIGHPGVPPLPALGEALWGLLFGMLGLGAMRSYDKQRETDLRR